MKMKEEYIRVQIHYKFHKKINYSATVKKAKLENLQTHSMYYYFNNKNTL